VCVRIHLKESPVDDGRQGWAFVSPGFTVEEKCASTMDIEVIEGRVPDIKAEARFDGAGWISAQKERAGYRLRLHREGSGPPHTVACCTHDTSQVKLYVGSVAEPGAAYADLLGFLGTPLLRLLLANHLASRGGLLVHAAGGVMHDRALVFPGVSMAGKSTLMRSFQNAGLGESLLSDERIVLRCSSDESRSANDFEAWGTPWSSEARVSRNAVAPLAALLFPTKAAACSIHPLAVPEALRMLMPSVSFPWYSEEMGAQILETCARVVEVIPCYELRFAPGEEVVELLSRWSQESYMYRTAESRH
jgi:hypothetical protein